MKILPQGLRWASGRRTGGYRKLLLALGSFWDVWLLHFLPGSFIAPHTDPVGPDSEHHRVNLVLLRPTSGGQYIGRSLFQIGQRLVYFRPDEMEHSVSECHGNRWVLSVGWVRPRQASLEQVP